MCSGEEGTVKVESFHSVAADSKLKRTMTVMATCSAWEINQSVPHEPSIFFLEWHTISLSYWETNQQQNTKDKSWRDLE